MKLPQCEVAALASIFLVAPCMAVSEKIALTPSEINFSKVTDPDGPPGRLVMLTNTGRSSLTVAAIDTGCGCVEARLDGASVVEAGESRRVRVGLKPGAMVIGSHRYSLVVKTDTDDVAAASVLYDYDPDVRCIPATFTLQSSAGDLPTVGDASAQIVLYGPRDGSLRVTGLRTSDPRIAVTKEDVLPESSDLKRPGVRVKVSLPRTWPAGVVDENVVVVTDHPKFKEFNLPIRGLLESIVKVAPSALVISAVPGASFTRTIRLTSSAPMRLRRILCPKDLEARADQITDYKIEVSVTGIMPARLNAPTKLRIEFDAPDQLSHSIGVAFVPTAGTE